MNRAKLLCSLALSSALGCATTTANAPAPEAPAPKAEAPAPAPAPVAEKPAPLAPAKDLPPVPPRAFQQTAPMQLVLQPEKNTPLVSFRVVFRSGSADDPKGKEGLTELTAMVMAEGGTKELSSSQLLEALFPMAAELSVNVDKELTTFEGRVHKDNLERFFQIFSDVLLQPRFDPKEFARLRADAVNEIKNGLRSEDDETLGKVALDALVYGQHPYAKYTGGTVKGLQAITLDDVRAHATKVFTQDRMILGLAGAVDDALAQKVKQRLSALPATSTPRPALPAVQAKAGEATILKKETLSTAISMGYVYPLRREDKDFYAVMLALSHLGEHRQFNGVLFNELREKRGLNYGDYAYAENFIQQPGTTYTLPNIPRAQQTFTIWIRPVEPKNAVFATRGAVYFLNQLATEGPTEERFQVSRGFLLGYSRLWEQTSQRRLGQAIDNLLYGTPDFLDHLREALRTMTRDDVKAAAAKYLRPERLNFAFVTEDAEGLKQQLVSGAPSPITYASPKAPTLLTVDEEIVKLPLPIDPAKVTVQDAGTFMEQ